MMSFDFLLPKTKQVLTELSQSETMEDYTFVGGSALSCYLHHRLSEDLDFFTWNTTVDTEKLLPIFNREDLHIINRSAQQTDMLYKGVKITFFSNNFSSLSQSNSLKKRDRSIFSQKDKRMEQEKTLNISALNS